MEKEIAIVTGAAKGIGAGIAKRLAASKFTVVIIDLSLEACADTVNFIITNGGDAIGIAARF